MAEETEQKPEKQETQEEEKGTNSLFGPEGILMLTLALIFDFLTLASFILIFLFGIGLILAKIVYISALLVFGAWAFLRSGTLPGKGKAKDKMIGGLSGFFKRQWKKLAFRAIPAIGDMIPGMWTWTVYSELKG